MLRKLGKEAQANKDQARTCKAERAAMKKAADDARASVEELKARLAEAEKNLAVEAAKFESADSALGVIKAKLVKLGTEQNRLGKLVEMPVPGNSKDDEAVMALPGQLVADALRVVEKHLGTAQP